MLFFPDSFLLSPCGSPHPQVQKIACAFYSGLSHSKSEGRGGVYSGARVHSIKVYLGFIHVRPRDMDDDGKGEGPDFYAALRWAEGDRLRDLAFEILLTTSLSF